MRHDVHHITAADIGPLEVRLTDIAKRRAAIRLVIDKAEQGLSGARQRLADLAAGLAIGKPAPASATSAATAEAQEAASHAAVATNAQALLDSEEAEVQAQLDEARRLHGEIAFNAACGDAHTAAKTLDAAAAAYNAAYDRWKAARIHAVSIHPRAAIVGMPHPFSGRDPVLLGTLSLHREVVLGLTRFNHTPPDGGRVADWPV